MSKILEMRQKRAEVWDKARAFLDEHTNESGVMSAEDSQQYERMEQEVVDLGHTIDRGTLAAMMTATTWMDAGAALAQGFIDGMADPQTCPMDSAAMRTVNRKDAEAKVRLWLERHNPLKQGKMVQKSAAEDKTAPELSVADYQKQTSQKVQTHENPGIPADQLRRRLDLIKPTDR